MTAMTILPQHPQTSTRAPYVAVSTFGVALALLVVPAPLAAQAPALAERFTHQALPGFVFGEEVAVQSEAGSSKVWKVNFGAQAPAPAPERVGLNPNATPIPALEPQAPVARPAAYVYSDGYAVRAKIHRYASFATLPLFATQAVLGFQLYDDHDIVNESVRSSHSAVANTMLGLFGVNTVTGVWNLWEGRKNPTGRTRRFVHGALMLISDAGFVATGRLAPNDNGSGSRSAHRNMALASVAVATTGYLIMLFGQ